MIKSLIDSKLCNITLTLVQCQGSRLQSPGFKKLISSSGANLNPNGINRQKRLTSDATSCPLKCWTWLKRNSSNSSRPTMLAKRWRRKYPWKKKRYQAKENILAGLFLRSSATETTLGIHCIGWVLTSRCSAILPYSERNEDWARESGRNWGLALPFKQNFRVPSDKTHCWICHICKVQLNFTRFDKLTSFNENK